MQSSKKMISAFSVVASPCRADYFLPEGFVPSKNEGTSWLLLGLKAIAVLYLENLIPFYHGLRPLLPC
jgi:hypothetical protein